MPVAFGTDPGTAVWNQPFEQGPADIELAGGASPSGTVAQGGNVWEWEETQFDLVNDDPLGLRAVRGGDWISSISPFDLSSSFRNVSLPTREPLNGGLRVVRVPEPHTLPIVELIVLLVMWWRVRLRLNPIVDVSTRLQITLPRK